MFEELWKRVGERGDECDVVELKIVQLGLCEGGEKLNNELLEIILFSRVGSGYLALTARKH